MQRPLWVTAAGTMDAIALVDPGVARDAFESDHAIALGGRAGAIAGRAWASCAAFEGELAAGTIAADVRVAMYDPERWRATPPEEQADPASAMERFGRIAAEHSYIRIITLHPGLMTAAGTGFALAEGETEEAAYLRSGLTGAAARAADIVDRLPDGALRGRLDRPERQRLQRDLPLHGALLEDVDGRVEAVLGGR